MVIGFCIMVAITSDTPPSTQFYFLLCIRFDKSSKPQRTIVTYPSQYSFDKDIHYIVISVFFLIKPTYCITFPLTINPFLISESNDFFSCNNNSFLFSRLS